MLAAAAGTLAQVEKKRQTLSLALGQIKNNGESRQHMIGFIIIEHWEAVLEHEMLVDEYPKRTGEDWARRYLCLNGVAHEARQ